MKVILTPAAEADLAEIGDYIAADNPARARSFVRELRGKARQLADMPRGFPLVPRYERHGIRRRPHGDYLIFYRVEDWGISIIHILHGARDIDRILLSEGET